MGTKMVELNRAFVTDGKESAELSGVAAVLVVNLLTTGIATDDCQEAAKNSDGLKELIAAGLDVKVVTEYRPEDQPKAAPVCKTHYMTAKNIPAFVSSVIEAGKKISEASAFRTVKADDGIPHRGRGKSEKTFAGAFALKAAK